MDLTFPLIGIGIILFAISVNFLIYKLLISRAVRKKIIPYLKSHNSKLVRIYRKGIYNTGNFKPKSSLDSMIVIPGGNAVNSIYRELEYENES